MAGKEDKLDKSLRAIAKTSIIVFLGVFISKIATYAFRVIAARHYGPEAYGLFSLSLMVVGWFVIFSSLGFLESLVRFVPFYNGKKEGDKVKFAIKVVAAITLTASIISAIILFFLSEYIAITIFKNASLILFLKISSLVIVASVISTLYSNLLRAYEKISEYSFMYNILQSTAKTAFLILFVVLGVKSQSILIAYLLGLFVLFLASYMYCRIKLPEMFGIYKLSKENKKEVVRDLFSYSWPTVFQGLVASVLFWIDSFSIGYYKTVGDVGIYNAVIPIAMLLGTTTDMFMQLFFPMVNREYAKNNKELVNKLSQQVGKWVLIVNIPAVIIMLIFPGAVINILFGAQYLPGATSLRLLAIGNLVLSFAMISYYLLMMAGRTKIPLLNTSIAAVANIILNAILVPRYGINGAAISTTICFFFLSFAYIFEAKKYVSATPFTWGMLKIVFISIIPLIFLLVVREFITINLLNLIIVGIIFVILYYVIMLFGGGFDRKDKMIIDRIKHKLFVSNPIVSYFFRNE